jgi:hypothetical protein
MLPHVQNLIRVECLQVVVEAEGVEETLEILDQAHQHLLEQLQTQLRLIAYP